jgi:hypothetical protein
MPDLSSYIDFSVRFDLTTGTPRMILTDTSTYPPGVEEDITGYFSITSPDKGVDSGSWASPDVTWDGDSLTPKDLVLRLNDKGNIQCGSYTVVYNIDHPDYIPTVLSRTFSISYVPVTLNLVENFDVFSPQLKYYDQTVYGIPNFSYTILLREWEALSIPTGSINVSSPTASIFDMVFGSDYYDAVYQMSFGVQVLYESDSYSYLTILDQIGKEWTTSADTPPSIEDLVGYLNDLKTEMDANINNCTLHTEYKKRYEYAASLLFNILQSCKVGLTLPLKSYVEEFLSVTNNFVSPPYVNTNQIIEPYDCACESTTGSLVLIDEFIVGDPTELQDGDTVYTNVDMTSKPMVFVDGIRLTYRVGYPGRHVSFDLPTNTITFSTPLNSGEVVSIYI